MVLIDAVNMCIKDGLLVADVLIVEVVFIKLLEISEFVGIYAIYSHLVSKDVSEVVALEPMDMAISITI